MPLLTRFPDPECRQALHAFCSLGGLMLIFYLLDGPSPIFPQGERTYIRDQYIFVLGTIASHSRR